MVVYSYFLEKEVSSLNPPVNYRHHINFKLIAQLFFEKSSFFIELQFLNLFKSVDKIVWTEEEDFLLTNSIRYLLIYLVNLAKLTGVVFQRKFLPPVTGKSLSLLNTVAKDGKIILIRVKLEAIGLSKKI